MRRLVGMARRPIGMKKIREIVRLHLGSDASVRQIATACGIGRSTVSEYVARIAASGLT
jgi:transposase